MRGLPSRLQLPSYTTLSARSSATLGSRLGSVRLCSEDTFCPPKKAEYAAPKTHRSPLPPAPPPSSRPGETPPPPAAPAGGRRFAALTGEVDLPCSFMAVRSPLALSSTADCAALRRSAARCSQLALSTASAAAAAALTASALAMMASTLRSVCASAWRGACFVPSLSSCTRSAAGKSSGLEPAASSSWKARRRTSGAALRSSSESDGACSSSPVPSHAL